MEGDYIAYEQGDITKHQQRQKQSNNHTHSGKVIALRKISEARRSTLTITINVIVPRQVKRWKERNLSHTTIASSGKNLVSGVP